MCIMKAGIENEKGIVLVVALFMLALLTMIGMASMMTTTTEVDISANEKFVKKAFYQAESGMIAAAELLVMLNAEEQADPQYGDTKTQVMVNDIDFALETMETKADLGGAPLADDARDMAQDGRGARAGTTGGKVQKDGLPTISSGSSPVSYSDLISDPAKTQIYLTGDFNALVDVDKMGAREPAGSATEFGSGAEGSGADTKIIRYEIEAIGLIGETLKLRKTHTIGFEFIPRR